MVSTNKNRLHAISPHQVLPAPPALFFLLSVVVTCLCWLQLQRWYDLGRRYDTPYFAYEKLEGRFDSPILRHTIWVFLALAVCYALGLFLLNRLPAFSREVKAGIVLSWLGPGLCAVFIFPAGALDAFRYMVALKAAFFYHENPYVHGFMRHKDDSFATHAFLLHLPNAKGPTWLWLSAIPAYIAGFDDQQRMLIALKLFNLLLIGLTGLLLYRAAGGGRNGWIAGFLYASNPLVLLEGVGNVHNDVIAAAFLVAALIALRQNSWTAGPLLVATILVKYFAVQFTPLFLLVMLIHHWGWRKISIAAVTGVMVAAVLILPFWDDGAMIDGIQRVESAYDASLHVSITSLERQYRLQDLPSSRWGEVEDRKALAAEIFLVLSLPVLWAVRKGWSPERATNILYGLFLLFLTLFYPWYLLPLMAVMGLARSRVDTVYLVIATGLALLYYPFYVYAHFNSGWKEFHVHLFLACFLTLPMIVWMLGNGLIALRRLFPLSRTA